MPRNSPALNASIAATRFGMGAKPGEIAQATADPQGWLAAQIRPDGADVYPGMTGEQAGQAIQSFRFAVRDLKSDAAMKPTAVANPQTAGAPSSMASGAMTGGMTMTGGGAAAPSMAGAEMMRPNGKPPLNDIQMQRQALYQPVNQEVQAEVLARAQLGASTDASFRERWALFWSNHFTTAGKNQEMRLLSHVFEREAIRPHVFGRFETLLIASSTHPGMLAYLDQQQSVGPGSVQIQRAVLRQGPRAKAGLNENLAREIMELHTVGADGGYTQADVTEFARALTGWGIAAGQPIDGPTPIGAAVFREVRHEPGDRTIMARRYGQAGSEQARAVLIDLAARPQTAHRICTKIAAHFVSDTPDPALVARLEAAWKRSDGDLSQVALALVKAPEAWAPQQRKLKKPYELILSSYRAAGAKPMNVQREVMGPLTSLGQRPFDAPQPNGWSDQAMVWAAPDAVVKRLFWAQGFAGTYAPQGDIQAAATEALGARLAPVTATALSRAESRPEAYALLIMSPEFQRR
ncbi:hypothetical protein BH09PSE2_BH09PSE2_25430 [soil metagenome]